MGIFIKNSKFEKAEEVLTKHFPPKNTGKVRLLAKPFFHYTIITFTLKSVCNFIPTDKLFCKVLFKN